MTRDLAAIGVQNKFDKMIFSSSTLCSFRIAIAFITVFPVPLNQSVIILRHAGTRTLKTDNFAFLYLRRRVYNK